jgi:hypothetical protein
MLLAFLPDWTTGLSRFDPRQGQSILSTSLWVLTSTVAHPASCTTGTVGSFPRSRAHKMRDAYRSRPSNAEVKNE